jgi:hypothetical protein
MSGIVTGATISPTQYSVSTNDNTAQFSVHLSSTSSCGATTNKCLFFTNSGISPFSVIRPKASATLSVSPNPASTTLTVQVADSLSTNAQSVTLDQPYQLSISDRFSRKVFSTQSNEKLLEIPLHNLPPDIYYLNLIYKDAVVQKQIVIKR